MHSVGGDHQVVGGGQGEGVGCLGPEVEADPESGAALVQDLQEAAPSEGGEAVAAGGQQPSAVHDVHVVPAHELTAQGGVDHGVRPLDAAEGLVGEDHAEAEGVVGRVAFPQVHVVALAGQECGGVEPARPAAHDGGPQALRGVRGHGRYLPFHWGGRFPVKAAWNSA